MMIWIYSKCSIWTWRCCAKNNFRIPSRPYTHFSIWIRIVFLLECIMNRSSNRGIIRRTYIIFFHNKYLSIIFLICCLKSLNIIKFLIRIWRWIRVKIITIIIKYFLISWPIYKRQWSCFSCKYLPIVSFIYSIMTIR